MIREYSGDELRELVIGVVKQYINDDVYDDSVDVLERKYELINETGLVDEHVLYRIRALRDIVDDEGNVVCYEGDVGGYIESDDNLSHTGSCWVYGRAFVYGNARVYGSAMVYENAMVYGNARVSYHSLVSYRQWYRA